MAIVLQWLDYKTLQLLFITSFKIIHLQQVALLEIYYCNHEQAMITLQEMEVL